MSYELHYWPGIQGRGECVRLALEAGGAPYVDVARGAEDAGQGLPALLGVLHDAQLVHPPFAPPFLKDGALLIGLGQRVAALALVAAYLCSERRLPFNQEGIFRRYPELDVDAG
jgi:hypothetical protein